MIRDNPIFSYVETIPDNLNVVLNQNKENTSNMRSKYTTPVITVKPDDSIFDTLHKMQVNFIKHIVVVMKNKPVGIVTERDINRFLENDKTRAIKEIPINHVMQKNVITVTEDQEDHFIQCATRMDIFKIGSIVLVDDDGKIIGIITKTDIAKAFSVIYGGKYQVKNYMSHKVVTCRKSDTLKFALNILNINRISRLVVTDEQGNAAGIITTNTFLTCSDYFTKGNSRSMDYLLPIKSQNLHVSDLLTEEVITISPEEDLATAASIIVKNKISGIPVIDNGNLVGIISNSDIVRAFAVVGSHEELQTRYQNFY